MFVNMALVSNWENISERVTFLEGENFQKKIKKIQNSQKCKKVKKKIFISKISR